FGGVATGHHGKLSAAASVVRLTLDPTDQSTAGAGFKATQLDAWVGYDVASHASVEVGILRRTADPEFAAQSLGALRVGVRATSEISLQRRHSISAKRSVSGTRSRQLGHTAYSATPGNRAGFLGRGTTDQRRGGAVEISSADRGTLTRSPMTSTTASGGRSLR